MIQAIIFDCFGVVISDALSVMCEELLAQDPDAVQQIWQCIDRSNRGELGFEESSLAIANIFGIAYPEYRARLDRGENKNMPLLSYIEQLRGQFKTAMLSNVASRQSLDRRFDTGELERYFDVVVASGDVGYAKPEARAYETVADQLGVRLDTCVFIDDREPYCQGAQAVGMHTILFQNFERFKTEFEELLYAENESADSAE
jgi:HAD superfamily hydrolase (TIGR01509 family)